MADIVQLKENGVAKYMKTHAKAIEGVDGVLVKATGNETILGTKNFQDGIQISGKKPVLTKTSTDYLKKDSSSYPSVISGGSMELSRHGDLVYFTCSFQLAAARHNQTIWSDMPSWAASQGMVRGFVRSGSTMVLVVFDPSSVNNLVCSDSVAKDAWLTGSFSWPAKDPY